MKLQVYAVYDAAVGCYMQPFFLRSKGEALRSFMDAVSDRKTQFSIHPEDFSLFQVGEYEEATGTLIPSLTPVKIVAALDVVRIPPPHAGNGTDVDGEASVPPLVERAGAGRVAPRKSV